LGQPDVDCAAADVVAIAVKNSASAIRLIKFSRAGYPRIYPAGAGGPRCAWPKEERDQKANDRNG
jgi:hypothetical protein